MVLSTLRRVVLSHITIRFTSSGWSARLIRSALPSYQPSA